MVWPQIDEQVHLVREDGRRCRARVQDDGGPARAVTEPRDPAWRALAGTGEPEVRQRRSYARGAAAGVAVELTRRGDPRPRDGWLLDLGEGGARVRLPDRPDLAADEALLLEVGSDGRTVVLEGAVLRTDDVPSGTEVIVVFPELPEASAVQVRRLVVALQRQNRR